MGDQFMNCPKCGIKNRAEDATCGICNSVLQQHSLTKGDAPNYGVLSMIAILLVASAWYIIQSNRAEKISPVSENAPVESSLYSSSEHSQTVHSKDKLVGKTNTVTEAPDEILIETQLAIINDGKSTPSELTTMLFNELLNSLKMKFPENTKKQIANGLVTCYNMIKQSGSDDSLLQFAVGFNAFSDEIEYDVTLAGQLAMYTKITYQP